MIAALQEVLERLCDAYCHGSSLVLLFDYDGTLTPIVEHPRLAVLDRKTRRLLAHLADRPRVQVGILSGRSLDELKSLVRLPGICLAGTGGMEIELRGYRIIHPRAGHAADTMNRLATQLRGHVAAYKGAWLEKKILGLTVHYRQMAGQLLGSLQAAVTEATQAFAHEVRIVQGPKAWEIIPTDGWNKGTAVRLILADLATNSDALFYAGDSANDAEAIEEVAAMGGMTLGIGPDSPSAAEYRLPNHAAFRAFLGSLDATLENRKPHFTRSAKDYLGLYGFWKSTLPTSNM
jgi:trehalose 6-phosphate phosphatase